MRVILNKTEAILFGLFRFQCFSPPPFYFLVLHLNDRWRVPLNVAAYVRAKITAKVDIFSGYSSKTKEKKSLARGGMVDLRESHTNKPISFKREGRGYLKTKGV